MDSSTRSRRGSWRPGQSYGRLRTAFTDLLNDRWYALLVTTKYLGGATTARDHRGDPGARPAVVNVPAAQQREALAFLTEAGFGERAYRFPPDLLSRLGPERWMHWGASPGADGRLDFPLHDWALAQQGSLLGQLLDPTVLARIRDAELRAAAGEPTMAIPELFTTLTRAIWAEAALPGAPARSRPRNITSVRRDLQRLLSERLIRMIVSPAPDTPEDARTLARATLASLGAELDRALAVHASRSSTPTPEPTWRTRGTDSPGAQRPDDSDHRNGKVMSPCFSSLPQTLPRWPRPPSTWPACSPATCC